MPNAENLDTSVIAARKSFAEVLGLIAQRLGVKGELACVACGRCEFGSAGCRTLQVATLQAQSLSSGDPEH